MLERILVVSADRDTLNGAVRTLRTAGFDATGAATFEEGSDTIRRCAPRLLIADERLGAYNGLHLVLRGHAVSPNMLAIIASPKKNAMLEADAQVLNAGCVVTPIDPDGWVDPVRRLLDASDSDERPASTDDHLHRIPPSRPARPARSPASPVAFRCH